MNSSTKHPVSMTLVRQVQKELLREGLRVALSKLQKHEPQLELIIQAITVAANSDSAIRGLDGDAQKLVTESILWSGVIVAEALRRSHSGGSAFAGRFATFGNDPAKPPAASEAAMNPMLSTAADVLVDRAMDYLVACGAEALAEKLAQIHPATAQMIIREQTPVWIRLDRMTCSLTSREAIRQEAFHLAVARAQEARAAEIRARFTNSTKAKGGLPASG